MRYLKLFKKIYFISIIFTSIILEPFQPLEEYCLESFPSDKSKKQMEESSTGHRDYEDDEDSEEDEEEEIEENYDDEETEEKDSDEEEIEVEDFVERYFFHISFPPFPLRLNNVS